MMATGGNRALTVAFIAFVVNPAVILYWSIADSEHQTDCADSKRPTSAGQLSG